jgi:hypothetical protein
MGYLVLSSPTSNTNKGLKKIALPNPPFLLNGMVKLAAKLRD